MDGDDHSKISIIYDSLNCNQSVHAFIHCRFLISFVGKWWRRRCDELIAQLRDYSDEHFELKITEDSEWHGKLFIAPELCSVTATDDNLIE